MKIGDKLFTSPWGRPEKVEAESGEITGETMFSWLVGDPRFKRCKVNKRSLVEADRGFSRMWRTAEQVEDYKFVRQHRHRIAHEIYRCEDVERLKKVAEILEVPLR